MGKINLLYFIMQCTWGIIQTFLGFLLFVAYRSCKHEFYHSCIKTYVDSEFSLSLGLFIFVSKHYDAKTSEIITKHEYGHTIQSLILGPLYLIVIGWPSFIWCRLPYFQKIRQQKKIPYSSFVVERWADELGEKFVCSAKTYGR